jgi:hypothetical protein
VALCSEGLVVIHESHDATIGEDGVDVPAEWRRSKNWQMTDVERLSQLHNEMVVVYEQDNQITSFVLRAGCR